MSTGARRTTGSWGPTTSGRRSRFGIVGHVIGVFAALTPRERRRVGLMFASITALHVIGFGVFLALVVPSHYKGLGIGVTGLAYSLGLRHAFDADLDNEKPHPSKRSSDGAPAL